VVTDTVVLRERSVNEAGSIKTRRMMGFGESVVYSDVMVKFPSSQHCRVASRASQVIGDPSLACDDVLNGRLRDPG
jgi:hypothetical protein